MIGFLRKISCTFKKTVNHIRKYGTKNTLEKISRLTKSRYQQVRISNSHDMDIFPGGPESERTLKNIIYVGHDAKFYGAQILTLHIIKILTQKFKYKVHLIIKQGGELENQYKEYAHVYNMNRDYRNDYDISGLISRLYKMGADIAITNTVICGDIVELLSKNKIRTISLVHELTETIKSMNAEEFAKTLSKYADKVVFPSEFVRRGFEKVAPMDNNKVVICPQGFYLKNKYKNRNDEARVHLRNILNIEQDSAVILGMGAGCFRKGIDLFFDTASKVNSENQKVYFVWVGRIEEDFVKDSLDKLKVDLFENNIILLDQREDISFFHAGSDLFLMTSREDPFPSVVLEAMNVGLPVIGFYDAGGFVDIVTDQTGALVPYCDTDAMARKVELLLSDRGLLDKLGTNASKLTEEKFSFKDYIYSLMELLGHKYEKVGAVVPNYNYGRYMEQRIQSVLDQTYPLYDLVILDDCSTDDSVKVINEFLSKKDLGDDCIFLQNVANSGSVFRQWKKGVSHTKGDYIWIAEADDLCENDFLEKVISGMTSDDIVLGYTQSKQIDSDGDAVGSNYLEYTKDIDIDKWTKNYVNNGLVEIVNALSVKNTIPNVSAVVFKKPKDLSVFDELDKYKIAGDWLFYVRLLEKGNVLFIAESLNIHRRHMKSVTISENNELHFREIVSMQEYICQKYQVTGEVRKKVLDYREEVGMHLGVN